MTRDEWEKYFWEMKAITEKTPTSQSRWSTYFEQVVQDEKTGKYYLLEWAAGSTEYQELDFEDMFHQVTEVKPVQKTVTVYEKI